MRKNVFGRQFKRDKNERKALFKGLMSSFILNDSIKTTEQKAKSIKGQVEKLVTKAKKGGTQVNRLLEPHLTPDAIKKLVSEVAPRFKERPGGYTRLIKLGERFTDNASMVLMEWVESEKVESEELKVESQKAKEDKKVVKKEVKRTVKKTEKKEVKEKKK